jgi:hypothetical protein
LESGRGNPDPPAGSDAASDVAPGDMGLGDWVWAEADQTPQTSPLAAVAHATSRGARIENPPDNAWLGQTTPLTWGPRECKADAMCAPETSSSLRSSQRALRAATGIRPRQVRSFPHSVSKCVGQGVRPGLLEPASAGRRQRPWGAAVGPRQSGRRREPWARSIGRRR